MGQLIIPDGAIVYVDTVPVIYSVETHPDCWALLRPLWRSLHSFSMISMIQTPPKPQLAATIKQSKNLSEKMALCPECYGNPIAHF
jgi:hypothetical protein